MTRCTSTLFCVFSLTGLLACDDTMSGEGPQPECAEAKCDAYGDDDGTEDDTGAEAPPHAIAPAGACADDDVLRIQRPVDPTDPDSPMFDYAVRVSQGTDPEAPVIVHLPGGPGQTSIALGREGTKPGASTVIYTDPRGVGCNTMVGPVPEEVFFATDTFAADVIAVLEHLEARDWAVYGHSYGTLLATVTAYRAVESGWTAPRAVVLEGTVGRAMKGNEYEQAFHAEWALVVDGLPSEVTDVLTRDEPLGLDAETWGRAMSTALNVGGRAGEPEFARAVLGGLADESSHDAVREFVGLLGAPIDFPPQMRALYGRVACNEIADLAVTEYALVEGKLVANEVFCEDVKVLEPFDAADFPAPAPIVYVQGTNDPATPMVQTEAHIERQPHADRYLVTVDGTGHSPWSMTLGECTEPLWAAILGDDTARADALQTALDECAWPTELTVMPAE